jgi:outer membrane protein OmpA-like peptidoglycan-associated protein/tetratricopeptide (TPR) repeat protein
MRSFIFFMVFTPCLVFGQLNNVKGVLSSSFNKANNLYDLGFYSEAIRYYEEAILANPDDQKSIERAATCYLKTGNYKNSFAHYSVLFELTAVEDMEIIQNYAEVSLATGNLETASYYYSQLLELDETNRVNINRLNGVLNYSSFYKDSALVSISPIGLNTEDSEFGLRPYVDGISIVSSKSKDLVIQRNYLRPVESFTNLYWYHGVDDKFDSTRSIIKLKNHLSSNDGPLSRSDKFIAISRNNGKSKKDIINTLGIYFYRYEFGELIFDSEFAFNSSRYSNTHPWLNTVGDTLFYASNMEGSNGGFDIYYSVLSNYNWSTPMNLGNGINTPANELFPMMENGVLYFTSNGHKGLGGLDNYKVNLKEVLQDVINLGFPINSGYDDMSIYVQSDSGYVASNRPGGEGMDDIYQFKITPAPVASIKVTVMDKLNEMPVEDVSVNFKTLSDSLNVFTGKDGIIDTLVTPDNFVFHIIKEGYEHESFPAIIHNGDEYEKTVYIEPIIDLEVIAPDSIMFHLGKFELKAIAEEELILIEESMKKYPHLKLMIAAHTDSRGSSAYNQTLSEKRAEATFNYLVKLGVDPTKITKSGFGESRLLNRCKDGVKCSEEEHAANRRIEFFLAVEFEEESADEIGKPENN